jgi:hypothetical protein
VEPVFDVRATSMEATMMNRRDAPADEPDWLLALSLAQRAACRLGPGLETQLGYLKTADAAEPVRSRGHALQRDRGLSSSRSVADPATGDKTTKHGLQVSADRVSIGSRHVNPSIRSDRPSVAPQPILGWTRNIGNEIKVA